MTNAISRKEAESCRRVAMSTRDEAERRACVAIWNAFCEQEQARIASKKTYGQVLPGVYMETAPAVDDRRLASINRENPDF